MMAYETPRMRVKTMKKVFSWQSAPEGVNQWNRKPENTKLAK
jgi:hypothetical protein